MKRTAILVFSIISLSIVMSSCSKYGCPGHIAQRNQLDESLALKGVEVSSIHYIECAN